MVASYTSVLTTPAFSPHQHHTTPAPHQRSHHTTTPHQRSHHTSVLTTPHQRSQFTSVHSVLTTPHHRPQNWTAAARAPGKLLRGAHAGPNGLPMDTNIYIAENCASQLVHEARFARKYFRGARTAAPTVEFLSETAFIWRSIHAPFSIFRSK